MAGSTGQAPPEAPRPTRLIEFDTAADGQMMLACHHLRGGEINRVEARGAKAVDLNPRHMVAIIGGERCRPGNVAARLADGIDAAEHDIVHKVGVETAAILDRPQHSRGEPKGRDLVQRAVGLAAPARGADMIVNESFGHVRPPGLGWSVARQNQNCSAGSAIIVPAPVEMRARWALVSGMMRSMKYLPVSSFASIAAASPLPDVLVAIAALAICAHM